MSSARSPRFASALPLLLLATLAACEGDATGPDAAPPTSGEFTVNAADAFAYLAIDGDSLRQVAVTNPATSTAWDIGLFGLSTVVNGGAAGPGTTSAYCICRTPNPTIEEVQAFVPVVERKRFDAVTAAAIPAASAFRTDEIAPAITGWFTGTAGTTATANPARAFVVVDGQVAPVYAKLQVTGIADASAARPGRVTIRWAIQPSSGTAAFGATREQTFTLGSTPVYVNLATGTEVGASGAWQVAFDGWKIRINGGASGTGQVSIAAIEQTPFDAMTSTFTRALPIQAFQRDGFAGAFAQPDRQWEYVSSNQTVYPTFDVYLLKRGDAVFKLQFPSYYDAQGQSRRITVRYQRLR
jgi:hypothetical protein